MKGRVGAIAAAVLAAITAAVPASAATTRQLAPGVTYRTLDTTGAHGVAHAHVIDVDLTRPHVAVDLLHPAAVADRQTVSAMADAQHALAGVNGDFFNISEPATHPASSPPAPPTGPRSPPATSSRRRCRTGSGSAPPCPRAPPPRT